MDLPAQQTQSLPPMPRGEYGRVIEGPAERVAAAGGKLKIDPRLTQALLDDLEQGGADPLPLLAFTLQHLYSGLRRRGDDQLEDYDRPAASAGHRTGGRARAQAADADPRIPRDAGERAKLLRRGLIPWLAVVDPETASRPAQSPAGTTSRRRLAPAIDLLVAGTPVRWTRVCASARHRRKGPRGNHRADARSAARQWGLLDGWLERGFRPTYDTRRGQARRA